MTENKKDFTDHLSDLAEGIASFWVTAYDFGDFLGRISGLRDWQHGSVVLKDYYQQEAIEEVKIFWNAITSINNMDKATAVFNIVKKDIENRPMYISVL